MASKTRTVPFTGAYNTRIAKTNQAAGYSGVIGIGIVGLLTIGASIQASDKDERYINCFLTKEGEENYIVKRPGVAALNTPQSGSVGNAILVWSGQGSGTKIISAFGATDSSLYDGTTQLVTDAADTTAITGVAQEITETSLSGTATIGITSSDNTGWHYQDGGTVTKITDAQFPGNASKTIAGSFAHMDGYSFILDTNGDLWNSDLNSISSYGANSSIPANSYPDLGVAAKRFKTYIIAFGTQSMQFFRNVGNPFGSPLQRDEGLTVKIGAISAKAMAEISDSIFFCGATPQGGLSIFQYDGQLSRISTPEQDFQLVLAGPSNISLTTLRFYGRSFVLCKANTTTYVYVIEDKRWHEWTSTTPLWFKCAGLSTGTQILTYSISNIATGGKVYVINPASLVFTDDGSAFTATAQSREDDGGSSYKKYYEEFMLDADVEPSTSALTLSYSDDDYQTWTTHGTTIDLSAPDRLTRLGSSQRSNNHKRAWKLTHSANTALRIKAARYRASFGYA